MSLARFALRVAAVEALRGRTMVGENVRDSDMSAIDIEADGGMRTASDRPFIVVYTDEGTVTEAATRDLHANGDVDLVFEFGIASPMTVTDPETGESVLAGTTIPATDSAMEMALDAIDRQIAAALAGEGEWPTVWKKLSDRVVKIGRKRAVSTEEGVRFAARQMAVTLAVKPDPVAGHPLAGTSVWTMFRELVARDRPDLSDFLGGLLGDAALPTMQQMRERYGHTPVESTALGYGPYHPGGEACTVGGTQVERAT